MSHKITYKTALKDVDLAQSAAKALGMATSINKDTMKFSSGALRGASLDLRSGVITSDSDWKHEANVERFQVAYNEAKATLEISRQGHTILGRTETTVNGQTVVQIMCESFG